MSKTLALIFEYDHPRYSDYQIGFNHWFTFDSTKNWNDEVKRAPHVSVEDGAFGIRCNIMHGHYLLILYGQHSDEFSFYRLDRFTDEIKSLLMDMNAIMDEDQWPSICFRSSVVFDSNGRCVFNSIDEVIKEPQFFDGNIHNGVGECTCKECYKWEDVMERSRTAMTIIKKKFESIQDNVIEINHSNLCEIMLNIMLNNAIDLQ